MAGVFGPCDNIKSRKRVIIYMGAFFLYEWPMIRELPYAEYVYIIISLETLLTTYADSENSYFLDTDLENIESIKIPFFPFSQKLKKIK